jgi:hypothetical protein
MTYLSPYPLKRRLDHDGPALCGVARAPHWQVTRRFANHCRQRQEQSVLQVRDCRPVRGAGRHRRRSSPFRCPVLAEPILHQPSWRTEVWRRDPSCTSAGCVRKLTRERQRRCDGRLLDIRGARPGRGCWRGYFSTPRIAPPHAVQSSFAAASTMGVQLAGCRSQCCAPSISVPTLWPTSLSLWCVATPTLSIAAANMVMLLRVIIGVFPCFGLTLRGAPLRPFSVLVQRASAFAARECVTYARSA